MACLLVVVGVLVWAFRDRLVPPSVPVGPAKLPAFDPSSIVFEPPDRGDRSTRQVALTNPDDVTSYVIESLTAAGPAGSQGPELSLEHASLPHRLSPGDALQIVVTAKARQWDSWNGSVAAGIRGVEHPVVLRLFAESVPAWTPDPWRDLGAADRLVVSTRPLDPDRRWIGWLIAGIACLAGGGGYYAWLYHWRRLHLKPIAVPELDAPGKGFSIAAIGGTRRPLVRQKRTRRLADMLGQVRTDEFTDRLDLPRTIERTSRAGGFPDFAWQVDKITRRVLILEDALLDPGCATGVIDDLQRGLEQTGVEVERAWFRNGVSRFAGARGVGRRLRRNARLAASVCGARLYRRQRTGTAGGPRDAAAAERMAGGRGARSAQFGPSRRGGRSLGRSAAGSISGR